MQADGKIACLFPEGIMPDNKAACCLPVNIPSKVFGLGHMPWKDNFILQLQRGKVARKLLDRVQICNSFTGRGFIPSSWQSLHN